MRYTQFRVSCDNIFFPQFFANSMKFQNEIFVYFFISKFLPQVYVIWSHGVYWFLMEILAIIIDCVLQAVTDVMKKSTVDKDEEEEEEEVGGIDIAAARERMLEEDKIDKQIYRERIKQKHRVS